jgi:Na+/proline symporter
VDPPPPLPPPPPEARDAERTRRLLIGFAIWGAVVLVLMAVLGFALAVYVFDRHGNTISVRTPRPTISVVRLQLPS